MDCVVGLLIGDGAEGADCMLPVKDTTIDWTVIEERPDLRCHNLDNETAMVLSAWESMNDHQLDRNLQSVGREIFIAYFSEFCDRSRSSEDVAIQIEEERGYTEKSCRSRTSHARSIIRAGRATDALAMVSRSTSPRVPDHVKIRGSELIRDRASGLTWPRDSFRRRHRLPIPCHHPSTGSR